MTVCLQDERPAERQGIAVGVDLEGGLDGATSTGRQAPTQFRDSTGGNMSESDNHALPVLRWGVTAETRHPALDVGVPLYDDGQEDD
jgi:hypothetical protein